MTDKVKDEFEAWVMRQVEDGYFYGGYTEGEYDLAWSAWQASREVIEIELPPVRPLVRERDEGANEMRAACSYSIGRYGLKVKP